MVLLALTGGMDLTQLQSLLNNGAFAICFGAMLLYWAGATFPQVKLLAELGLAGMIGTNLTIAALLAARWIDAGYFPLSNLYESLFFLAWGITTLHLVALYWSRSRWVGVMTAPVVTGIVAFAALVLPEDMQAAQPLVPALQSNWLMMHVTVMLLSYAALLVGSLLSVSFLIVTRGQPVRLKGNSLGLQFRTPQHSTHPEWVADPTPVSELAYATAGIRSAYDATSPSPDRVVATQRLSDSGTESLPAPPLEPLPLQRLTLAEILDNTSYRLIGLGFPLLTIGIIAGAVWANEAWGTYWSWDPKETWALITWLVFAAYLHARITKGWQGRRPALLASLGFVVVWVCYLGVNLLGKGLHSYGWFF
ncbi:MAG: c-type cytochrome biogenesis protein CcsB [Thermostichus sp. DG02_5_bins_236]